MWVDVTTFDDLASGFEVQLNIKSDEYRHRKNNTKKWSPGKPSPPNKAINRTAIASNERQTNQ